MSISSRTFRGITLAALTCAGLSTALPLQAAVDGWLHWRGPQQNGTSLETGLPDAVGEENLLWTYDISGGGEAVIAGDRVYSYGFKGEGPDLREYLTCLKAETGEVVWELGFNDFLSDTVYSRYAIGAPTVDSETGNIFLMTSPGIFVCVSPAGEILWEHSMMERFGMLTFPNGRRGAAVIDQELVIHHCITSYWGADGPARDRFFAFNKHTGEIVWSSTPGTAPKDSSFSTPVLGWANGERVLYAGTGCGNVVCVNVRTGEPVWRYHFSFGGVNSTVLLHNNDKLIAIHGKENIDASETGRMVALRLGAKAAEGAPGQVVLDATHELWRNPLEMFTSSPVLVGDRIYQVIKTGTLECVNANSGQILWNYKLGNSQEHASPLYSEGKLYIPMGDGMFHILRIKDDGVEVLDTEKLAGGCIGAPTAWNGRIYIHSKEKLYCFGKKGNNPGLPKAPAPEKYPVASKAVALQLIPSDVLLAPGESADFVVNEIDAKGFVAGTKTSKDLASLDAFIPPTARVKAKLNGSFSDGALTADSDPVPSAGAFRAKAGDLSGLIRGRVLPSIPFSEDFESFDIDEVQPAGHVEAGAEFAYPPLPWIGARFKWEIRDLDGTKVLRKTLDNVLFQRAITFFGHPEASNYTMEADVMTDGSRRVKSTVGVINQRYVIALIGNSQQLEVSSNQDRVKVSVPFRIQQKTWYRLKTRVDVAGDGSGVVRAKAWPRGEAEPAEWTIEVPHRVAHTHGSPGLFGFSPQSLFPVYVDNISITSND